MLTGVLIGYYVPNIKNKLGSSKFANVNIPMTIGLIWMMYPILCKVRYEILHKTLNDVKIWKYIIISIITNWIIAPLVMVVIGWATLPDLIEYRSGLVLVGTARCIAMVLIWNKLAGGDNEFCTIIVVINSLLQVALYGPLAYLFVVIFSKGTRMSINLWPIIQNVLVFLGIPLAGAIITRFTLYRISSSFYDKKFIPIIAPTSLLALLFVIIIMFASQGHEIIVPLITYFTLMFFSVLITCYYLCIPYKLTAVQSFTAASNNFELAIAVAASVYGETSKEAMAVNIGPLVEVPVLIGFVYALKFIKTKWYDTKTELCGCKED